MIENESWQLYGSISWSRTLDFSQGILFLKIKKLSHSNLTKSLCDVLIRPIKLNQDDEESY